MVELSKASITSLIQGQLELKSIHKGSESQHIISKEVERSNHHMEVTIIQFRQVEVLDLDQDTVIQIQELVAILCLMRVLKVGLKMAVFF